MSVRVRSKEFLALQRQWYRRLADEGFKDIEWTDDTGKSDSPYLRGANTVSLWRKQAYGLEEYYRLVGWYLHDTKRWDSAIDQQVWQLHAEGVDGPTTAKQLGISETRVYTILPKLRQRMRERYVDGGSTDQEDDG